LNSLTKYLLHLADNRLILGQRLGEWCGHGPVLEQDIALTNIALDLIGQARLIYQYAADLSDGKSEDDLAFLRREHEYLNLLLVELPNGNFADTVVRQYFFDVHDYLVCEALTRCTDPQLSAIAEKALKEVTYHKRWSKEWVVRLGDGTEESHQKTQAAVHNLWQYTGELFEPATYEMSVLETHQTPDVRLHKDAWFSQVKDTLEKASIQVPDGEGWMQTGGKSGRHTEHMGFLLTELQYMQRTYPAMQW
jgi:ring-1,2-phenylacetyl-CoA epoxidase subunit PaaC